jgi:hypothetical protein
MAMKPPEPIEPIEHPHAARPSAPSAPPPSRPGAAPLQPSDDGRTNAHGAQVVLSGDARNAARGGPHGTIEANTAARDAAIAAGHVTPDTVHAAATDIAREEVFVDPEIEVRRVAEEKRREMAQKAHALAVNPPIEPDGKTEHEPLTKK